MGPGLGPTTEYSDMGVSNTGGSGRGGCGHRNTWGQRKNCAVGGFVGEPMSPGNAGTEELHSEEGNEFGCKDQSVREDPSETEPVVGTIVTGDM